MKKVLSCLLIVVLLAAGVAAQDAESSVEPIVAMVADTFQQGSWTVDEVITGFEAVRLYYTGPSASPSNRRVFELALINDAEDELVAMAEDLVAVCYTVRGVNRSAQRQLELASITNEDQGVSEADLYFEYQGFVFLRIVDHMLVYTEDTAS